MVFLLNLFGLGTYKLEGRAISWVMLNRGAEVFLNEHSIRRSLQHLFFGGFSLIEVMYNIVTMISTLTIHPHVNCAFHPVLFLASNKMFWYLNNLFVDCVAYKWYVIRAR